MITLNFTCPHCGRENSSMGADRFLHSSQTAVLRLDKALCFDCHTTVQLARENLRRNGLWFGGEWR